MTFRQETENAAVAWKHHTPLLPEAARSPAPYSGSPGKSYDFCLPQQYAEHNLLPSARELALEMFAKCDIPWHDGKDGKPSNHLLSSQVQCANALAPLATDPAALRRAFAGVLDIEEVLPFHADAEKYDGNRFLAFEWTGERDYLGERKGRGASRGANATSADAAFRYVSGEGRIEIALVEWKYVEKYSGGPLHGGEKSMAVRRPRYRPLWEAVDGPLLQTVVPFDDLFVEPVYQLFRQHLLADQMEKAREGDAERVRVVLAAPSANAALHAKLPEALHHLRENLPGGWRSMLRRPDRFVAMDTAHLRGRLSADFDDRYDHMLTREAADPATALLSALIGSVHILRRFTADGGVLGQLEELSDHRIRQADGDAVALLAERLAQAAEASRLAREAADEVLSPDLKDG